MTINKIASRLSYIIALMNDWHFMKVRHEVQLLHDDVTSSLRSQLSERSHSADATDNSGFMAAPKPCAMWKSDKACDYWDNKKCGINPCYLKLAHGFIMPQALGEIKFWGGTRQ